VAERFVFDAGRVAYYEAAGWRAYYDCRFLSLFRLIVSMSSASVLY
jgi:hypothetical protein